ncbi:hypothetical protein [Streptomyces diastatochromogenes]|uniref:PknH-like extracellular domain-containing protein n=1 Tax=Streptomyces diastatochromogenes TaxID=42236 RepID=A0A233SLR9_STRDA|nr:hypothetical protein [Streptomyces diastatochromogenes]MCZ0988833.1 hypothetical protein [Streptomyces diastatochromogenes]OXY96519.1 hypothetical protein BEK98_12600 [Streptomyces diastatochromogenes]
MLIGAAAAVVAVAVAVGLAIVLGGRDQGHERVRTVAQARDLAKRVALAPADWGSGYVRSDPYETDQVVQSVADASCTLSVQPPANELAALERNAQKSDRTVADTATVVVHRDTASAAADIARFRADTRRCRTEYDSATKQKWEDVHAVDVPAVKGYDELSGEEGHQVADEAGQKVDIYYTQLTGRKGQVVVQATVARSGGRGQNREEAANALSLMLGRL